MAGDPVIADAAWFGAWLGAWSLVTFAAYGLDKRAAIRRRRRIPERRLHLLALGGGAVGGWLGMLVFRHKRRPRAIRLVLVVASAVEVVVATAILGTGRGWPPVGP